MSELLFITITLMVHVDLAHHALTSFLEVKYTSSRFFIKLTVKLYISF